MKRRLFRGLRLQLWGLQRWRDRNEEPRSAWPGVEGFADDGSNGAMEQWSMRTRSWPSTKVGEWPLAGCPALRVRRMCQFGYLGLRSSRSALIPRLEMHRSSSQRVGEMRLNNLGSTKHFQMRSWPPHRHRIVANISVGSDFKLVAGPPSSQPGAGDDSARLAPAEPERHSLLFTLHPSTCSRHNSSLHFTHNPEPTLPPTLIPRVNPSYPSRPSRPSRRSRRSISSSPFLSYAPGVFVLTSLTVSHNHNHNHNHNHHPRCAA